MLFFLSILERLPKPKSIPDAAPFHRDPSLHTLVLTSSQNRLSVNCRLDGRYPTIQFLPWALQSANAPTKTDKLHNIMTFSTIQLKKWVALELPVLVLVVTIMSTSCHHNAWWGTGNEGGTICGVYSTSQLSGGVRRDRRVSVGLGMRVVGSWVTMASKSPL